MIDFTGQQIGSYRLLRQLGVGGFASVYQGQHVRISTQHAAIKILHLSDVDVQKFQQEAETTAALVHPNIIRLFDFDIAQKAPFHETPFLVMDYAPGGSLRTRHQQRTQLPLTTVVEYIKVLAAALQFAHDKNVIHRDVKPDNILIGAQGELRLSDFGIAVLSQTGRTTLSTAYGTGGTPFYMAPEQCRGKPEKASDQYALAIMAYEWLCGHPPFTEGIAINIQFQHAFEPVPPLRQELPQLPEAIERIILTALAKDAKQRYDSVLAFAQVLECACAQPQTMQMSVQPQMAPTELLVPQSQIVQAKAQPRMAPTVLQASQPQRATIKLSVPLPIGTLLFRYTGHSFDVASVAWSPGGKHIASASYDKTVQVWDSDGRGQPFTHKNHSAVVYSVTWSPDGNCIASASYDRTVQVWYVDGSGRHFTYKGHSHWVNSVAWSPDGKRIASASLDKTVRVWNVDGREQHFTYKGHSDHVYSVTWSPDGNCIASASLDKTVWVWSADGRGPLFCYKCHSDSVCSVAWSPGGKCIASASGDGIVQVWNVDGSGRPFIYKGHIGSVYLVAWSPDGKRVASASGDKTVQVWNADGSGYPFIYKGHSDIVWSVAWSPDGKCIASASKDKTVQVWSAG